MNTYRFLLPGALVVALPLSVAAAVPNDGSDAGSTTRFLVQMRCSATATLPGDVGCGRLVPLTDGGEPGYRLTNGVNGAGRIDTVNLPITRNGKWRVVSPDVHVQASDGAAAGGVSVEAVGRRYLSIMGSWSPVAMSFFVSDECDRDPQDSNRFTDGWVLGPAQEGNARQGAGLTRSSNFVGHPGPGCPARYRGAAFTWERMPFTYASGRRFDSLVSVHYSAADAAGTPGPAEQRERVYLAYGIGMARWEKWSRDDWTNTKTARTTLAEAQAVHRSGRCNRPVADAAGAAGVTYGPVTEADGAWAERITVPGQTSHLWYMTKCEDYATLVRGPIHDIEARALAADAAFWR